MRATQSIETVTTKRRGSLVKSAQAAFAALILATGSAVPQLSHAESNIATGASPIQATARLDFQIVIPRFLFFRVGTAGTGNIDLIDFQVPAASVGDGNPVNATAASGDAGNGVVNVSVISNAGQIRIIESNNSGGGGMTNGATGTISYAEISTATSDANLPTPQLSDGGGNVSNPVLTAGVVTVRNAQWTYTYDNNNVPESGTYGTQVNGGRVTYTAANP